MPNGFSGWIPGATSIVVGANIATSNRAPTQTTLRRSTHRHGGDGTVPVGNRRTRIGTSRRPKAAQFWIHAAVSPNGNAPGFVPNVYFA